MEVGDRYRDGAYLAANPGWHEEDAPFKAAWIHALLERNRLSPERVGEVGCGAGGVLAGLRERMPGAAFTGYEVSPQAHELCLRREAPGLEFRLADLLADDPSVSFDLLLCIDVLEHVEDCFGFLRALKSRAGYTVFHIPLELFALSMLYRGFLLSQWRKTGHVHYFTRDLALALLADCGYEVVDTCYTPGYTLPHAYGWKDSVANVARRLAYPVAPDLAVRLFGGYSLLVLAR
ncbi:MAG: class I SAM-dependent methyltransferase [Methanospirillum sp.]